MLVVDADEDDLRIDLLHTNVRKYLCTVLGDAAVANFVIAELAFHHPEYVLDFGRDFPEPSIASALRR